jgi:methyl-accepting chemotaxis protein
MPLRLLAERTASGESWWWRATFPLRDLHQRVLTIMTISGLGTIVAALVAGVTLSLGPMRRVRHMQVMAAAIARGDLRRRLPDTHRRDEIDVIGIIINGMVEEIERLMGQVKGRPMRLPMICARR